MEMEIEFLCCFPPQDVRRDLLQIIQSFTVTVLDYLIENLLQAHLMNSPQGSITVVMINQKIILPLS